MIFFLFDQFIRGREREGEGISSIRCRKTCLMYSLDKRCKKMNSIMQAKTDDKHDLTNVLFNQIELAICSPVINRFGRLVHNREADIGAFIVRIRRQQD